MKNYLFNRINLNIFFTCLLIIVIIPLNLAKSYESAYSSELFISLLITASILSFVLIIFSSLILKIAFKFNIYSIYSSLVAFILLWVFATGNFLPVSGISGQFLNLNLPIRLRFVILAKIIAIVLFFIFLIKKDKNNFFFKFIHFFILISVIFLFLNIQNESIKYNENKISNFGKKNLIVLSFDGISGHKIYKEIINDVKLNQNLKDFKLYKNALTGAPFTSPSINIEINGEYKEKNFDNILNKKNIDTLVYNTYGGGGVDGVISDRSRVVLKGQLQEYSNAFEVNNFFQSFVIGSVGRWATPVGIIMINPIFYTDIYKSFINLITSNNHNKPNPFNFITQSNKVDLYEYDIISDNITYNDNLNNVVRMYHFTFTHWPILINENCKEIQTFQNTIDSFEYEEIMLKCVSKKIIQFLDNLRANNIYDNSMIIVKTDHAKPNCAETHHTKYKISEFFKARKCSKHYKDYPDTAKINNHFYYGVGRYKTFILIKDQNQKKNEIEISDKQVFLHDLSNTYCNFFFKPEECNYSNRNNLVKDENQFNVNKYDIYITKPQFPLSTTVFSNLKKYEISSDVNFLDFLKLNKVVSSN